MAKNSTRKSIEAELSELDQLRASPDNAKARAGLHKALESTRALLVTTAANIVAEAELDGFDTALAAAFERMLAQPHPSKVDPGCGAKTSAARALYRLGVKAYAVFTRGIRHRQPEPIWGGTQDTAVELRAVCALGLVRAGHPEALLEAAELLADPEPMARVGAAQAIAYSEYAEVGLPLLRLKARLGDQDARVSAACFSGLLALAPQGSLAFVATFLAHADATTREAALIALGESRLPEALPLLCSAAESDSQLRATAYTAIGLMRNDAAWDYLLAVVRAEGHGTARAALSALAPYRAEPRLRSRIETALAERGDAALSAHAERDLGLSAT